MTKNSIINVHENLLLTFGRRKTQNRAKTHRPSMSAIVLKKFGTQSHWDKFLNWGNHVNSVPDLTSPSPPAPRRSPSMLEPDSSFYLSVNYFTLVLKVSLTRLLRSLEILSALEDKIRIPARSCNILYVSVHVSTNYIYFMDC